MSRNKFGHPRGGNMAVPEFDPEKIPQRYLRVALVCLEQNPENYGFIVLFDDALLKCEQKDRDLLIDTLEQFCLKLRGRGEQQIH
jgi:hypothetical protein